MLVLDHIFKLSMLVHIFCDWALSVRYWEINRNLLVAFYVLQIRSVDEALRWFCVIRIVHSDILFAVRYSWDHSLVTLVNNSVLAQSQRWLFWQVVTRVAEIIRGLLESQLLLFSAILILEVAQGAKLVEVFWLYLTWVRWDYVFIRVVQIMRRLTHKFKLTNIFVILLVLLAWRKHL